MDPQANEQLINNFTNYSVNLSFLNSLTIMLVAFGLGLYFRFLYNRFTNTFSSKIAFGNSILLIIVSVAALIAVVKSSLALSLGLVGALSVVRFRTAVKEPFNLAFLLLSICAGISVGASQYLFTLIFSIIATIIILLIYGERSNKKNRSFIPLIEDMDTFAVSLPINTSLDNVIKILFKNTDFFKIISYDSSSEEGINIVVKIRLNDHKSLVSLERSLTKDYPGATFNFYSSPSS